MSDYLTTDQVLENAPKDLVERDVEAFGGKVRVRALTAHQQSMVKQASINLSGRSPDVAWAAMEMLQFRYGVIQPTFNKDQVKTLHMTAGASFAEVIAVIDDISGLRKEELREAQATFPGSNGGDPVSLPAVP